MRRMRDFATGSNGSGKQNQRLNQLHLSAVEVTANNQNSLPGRFPALEIHMLCTLACI